MSTARQRRRGGLGSTGTSTRQDTPEFLKDNMLCLFLIVRKFCVGGRQGRRAGS
jgi:hypothetical protein